MRRSSLALVRLMMVVIAIGLGGCAADSERRFQFSQVLMGVDARVEVYAPDESSARAAATAAMARIAELDAVMSDYRLDSESSRLCAQAGGPAVAVSEDLFRVGDLSLRLSRASGGAFDITAGPLVVLWREARRSGRLPEAAEIAWGLGRVGYGLVELDPDGRTIRLARAGMRLDFGGIGKGYAASEAAAVLRRAGRARFLVALAGDIVAGDPPPGRAGWSVEIERPDGKRESILLANRAVSSSGDTQQFVEIDGVRYSHIVDPATGMGTTSRIGAVVTAESGAVADALATAVCILGPERGRALVARFPGATVQVFEPAE
jgi:thiamine biosynthesis lipoprotein